MAIYKLGVFGSYSIPITLLTGVAIVQVTIGIPNIAKDKKECTKQCTIKKVILNDENVIKFKGGIEWKIIVN